MFPPGVGLGILVLFLGIQSHDAIADERSCVPSCNGILDLAGPRTSEDLRGLAKLVRHRIDAATTTSTKVDILNGFYFDILKFQPEGAVNTNEALLPSDVLRRRRGSCVGLAGIYLALAKLLNLPAAAVSVPNHVFVRVEGPDARLNVEMLQAGKTYEDDWYIRVHRIPQSSVASGVFLRSLSEREFLGEYYSTIGTYYSKLGDYGNSRLLYEAAMREAPRSPWAPYNLGNDLMKQGDLLRAIRLYDQSLALHPTHAQALNNRGIAHCRLGDAQLSRVDFETALEVDPGFSQARTNLNDLTCKSELKP